jgi:protein tyrosine/serine phosphatase
MHPRLDIAGFTGCCRLRTVVALILLTANLSYPQTANYGIRIPNFGQVNSNYYRGAQPKESDCMALKRMGIRTVIDLRKDKKPAAASWVQGAGMRYVNIPLSNSRPATAEQTKHFLELVNDPANWPVYVHCAGGKHRTGEMTAIYRIAHDAWTADQAFDEMQRYGFYSFPNHGSLKKYVYQFFQNFRNP